MARWQLVAVCDETGQLARPEHPLVITTKTIHVSQVSRTDGKRREVEVVRAYVACVPHVEACTVGATEGRQ